MSPENETTMTRMGRLKFMRPNELPITMDDQKYSCKWRLVYRAKSNFVSVENESAVYRGIIFVIQNYLSTTLISLRPIQLIKLLGNLN